MLCPSCGSPTRVLETRPGDDAVSIRRRRQCRSCARRFTTYERRESPPLHVRKRDGRRERFDRTKLRDGMVRAAYKRPVEAGAIDAIVDRIEAEVEAAGGELETSRIGDMCLTGLEDVDRITYLQFASVYRRLADVEDVQAELARLGTSPSSGDSASARARPAMVGPPVPSGSVASISVPPERARRAGRRQDDRRQDDFR